MRGITAKAIRKYVELGNVQDERVIPNIRGTVVKRNPIKYIKQIYNKYNKDQRRKFKIIAFGK